MAKPQQTNNRLDKTKEPGDGEAQEVGEGEAVGTEGEKGEGKQGKEAKDHPPQPPLQKS